MKRFILSAIILIIIINVNAQSLTDIDGNKYKATLIGKQLWMAQNLAATKASDGSEIKSYPYLGVDDSVKFYGRIYSWENALNACPQGWHLPSDTEWLEMIKYLGGPLKAGGKLKEADTTHWKAPNTGATNESGFSALPGGYRSARGQYINFKKNYAYFWSSTETDSLKAIGYYLTNEGPIIYRNYNTFSKDQGFAIRCIKD